MRPFFSILLSIAGMAGLFFSCKASKHHLSSPHNDHSLKAKVFMVPIAETHSTSPDGPVVNLQKALAMYKLVYLKWPENPGELAEMVEQDSLPLSLENFSDLSWTNKGDSLRVLYNLQPEATNVNLSAAEGKFTLFVEQETIRVADFSYKEEKEKEAISPDSIK